MIKKYVPHIVYIAIIIILTIALVVVMVNNKRDNTNQFVEYYNNKCLSFAMQNVNASEGQIVFIGDSLTDGYKLDDYYADLDLAVYNRGIGGDTTSGVLKRMDTSIFDIKPSKIVLLIGANDVNGGVGTKEIEENLVQIVSEIKQNLPNTKIYFISMIPQNDDIKMYGNFSAKEHVEKIMSINAKMEERFETEDNVIYIDLFSLLKDENNLLIKEYSEDGLHLNAKGYKIWTNTIKEYLR